MARYELRVKPSVAKDLRDVPRAYLERILTRMQALRDDPRPPGCEKLNGADWYRVRQGARRIVYQVLDADVVIEVIRVGRRREVHRDF